MQTFDELAAVLCQADGSLRDVKAGKSLETRSAISNSNRLWKGSAKMQGSGRLGDLARLMCSDVQRKINMSHEKGPFKRESSLPNLSKDRYECLVSAF